MPEPIGFVGLGAMGSRMAARLVAAGVPLVTWTRSGTTVPGADAVPTPAAVAEQCRLVLGCLLDDAAVERVYLGEGGLIGAAPAGTVLIEHGTYSPALAGRIAGVAAERGVTFLDAPVTGGSDGAADGTLVAMVGGPTEVIDAQREVFAHYLATVERVGPVGAGLTLKLVNQLLVAVHLVAASEAAALLADTGIDPEQARRILGGGFAASRMLDRELLKAVRGEFEGVGGFTIGGLGHVLELIDAALRAAGVDARVFAATRLTFAAATTAGRATADPAALVTVARRFV